MTMSSDDVTAILRGPYRAELYDALPAAGLAPMPDGGWEIGAIRLFVNRFGEASLYLIDDTRPAGERWEASFGARTPIAIVVAAVRAAIDVERAAGRTTTRVRCRCRDGRCARCDDGGMRPAWGVVRRVPSGEIVRDATFDEHAESAAESKVGRTYWLRDGDGERMFVDGI